MTEETIPQPEDPYSIAKYAVERELKISNEMFGLNYIIFRPP
jgi:UDP-glucose 4-epimerase